jgi:hypothetical protein
MGYMGISPCFIFPVFLFHFICSRHKLVSRPLETVMAEAKVGVFWLAMVFLLLLSFPYWFCMPCIHLVLYCISG